MSLQVDLRARGELALAWWAVGALLLVLGTVARRRWLHVVGAAVLMLGTRLNPLWMLLTGGALGGLGLL